MAKGSKSLKNLMSLNSWGTRGSKLFALEEREGSSRAQASRFTLALIMSSPRLVTAFVWDILGHQECEVGKGGKGCGDWGDRYRCARYMHANEPLAYDLEVDCESPTATL